MAERAKASGSAGTAESCSETAANDCREAIRQVWDWLDGELTPERIREIELHLSRCSPCQGKADIERRFLEALAATRDRFPAPCTLRARVEHALRAIGFCPDSRRSN